MIDSLSVSPIIPIQQRTAADDGDQAQPIKTDDQSSSAASPSNSTVPSDKDPSQKNHQKKKLEEVIKRLNDFLQPQHTSLKFILYQKLNQYYCQVIDDNTKEVIREIPPKKLLDAYAIMAEQLGLIVDKKI